MFFNNKEARLEKEIKMKIESIDDELFEISNRITLLTGKREAYSDVLNMLGCQGEELKEKQCKKN